MSGSSDALKALLAATIAPRLKVLGFRRVRNEWTRAAGTAIQRVGIQPHSGGGIFTVHVAVEFPALYDITGSSYRPTRAMYISPGQRLGFLMPDPRDRWWTVDNLTAGREMAEALEEYGVPWLERHSDLRVVVEEVANSHWRAASWIVLGDPDEARRVLVDLQHELERENQLGLRSFLAGEIVRTRGVLDRAGIPA